MKGPVVAAETYSGPRLLLVLVVFWCFPAVAFGANDITGTVRYLNPDQAAANDAVVLLLQEHGMREVMRTRTNASGAFTFHVQNGTSVYLVRVLHQGVAYEQRASAGSALSIPVFDAAAHVHGITGTIEILRAATHGSVLHVSDMYELKNGSEPPLTQASAATFEVCLPASAKMDSVLAAGPDKLGIEIRASPVAGNPGHYSVNFPLRPGTTKFAFNYDVPYAGRLEFRTWHAYPLEQLAIMIPPTMKFVSPSPAFEVLAASDHRYQVEAVNHLKAGDGPPFEVTGTGVLPSPEGPVRSQAGSEVRASAETAAQGSSRESPSVEPPDVVRLARSEASSETPVLGTIMAALLGLCVFLIGSAVRPRASRAAKEMRH